MLTSSTVIKMNCIAILVILAAVINECSARNNSNVESTLKVPCDHWILKKSFNMTRLFPPKENEAPIITVLKKLKESLKKMPANKSGYNMKHFSTVKKKELRNAINLTKKMNSTERGLQEIQIILYKFYIKLDKIVKTTENKEERAVEGNLLALLCLFVQSGVNQPDVNVTLLQQQQNVTEDEIALHRNTFKLELTRFVCGFKKSLSKLARKIKKNVKQTNRNGAKQIKKSATNKKTGKADKDVTNGRVTNKTNKTNKTGERKRIRCKKLSKKQPRRQRNKRRKNKKNKARKSRYVRKNKQNSRTHVRKKSRKGKDNNSK